MREVEDRQNTPTKSSSSRTKESSSATSYYSAHADFGAEPFEKPNVPKIFTYLELKQATGDFSLHSKLGEGEHGSVYKAVVRYPHEKRDVVVKRLHERYLQGDREWMTEVRSIGSIQHPNLVKLVGYCAEDRLLVYECFPNGSVRDHLSAQSRAPLSWAMRLQVAQDAANCLAYLHEAMGFKVVFGNFKASNVLLDDQWHAKLSDFAQSRLCISSMAIENVGYKAPEYHFTGNATSKSDVWSYGVFLYELITGTLPFDQSLPKDEQKLLEWVKPYLNSRELRRIVDPRLQGHYPLRQVKRLSNIANYCLAEDPKSRPRMTDVLNVITRLVTETSKPLVPIREATAPQRACEENKSSEDTKVKDHRRFIDRVFGDCGCLS